MMNLRVETDQRHRYDSQTGEKFNTVSVKVRDEKDDCRAIVMPDYEIEGCKIVEHQRYDVAHLFAAAPDLKRALSNLRDLCDFYLDSLPNQSSFEEALNKADAALQKAKYIPESETQAQDALEAVI